MWWLLILLLIPLLALAALTWILIPGISKYAARYYCGAIFASGRKPEDVAKDLYFSPVSLAKCSVNWAKKEVTGSVWGFGKRKARYVEGSGVKLIRGMKNEAKPISSHSKKAIIPHWPEEKNEALTAYLQPFSQTSVGRTHAAVVLHRGKLVAEVYAEGIGADSPLHSWSLTKSLMNALGGILVDQGRLSLDQTPGIPAWQQDARRDITVRHLLQMTSGLNWKETEKHFRQVSQMLFMQPDAVRYARSVRAAYAPGTHFAYASCNTNILSGLIRELFADDKTYLEFPQKVLFEPLGMNHSQMETDLSGNLVGSSFSMATARDWARFGQLYLQNGRIGDTQILSPEWIAFSKTPTKASGETYGAHFWLNTSGEFPDLPRDVYFASGFMGQRISIFPSQELVVVRMGLGFDSEFNPQAFLRGILDILKD